MLFFREGAGLARWAWVAIWAGLSVLAGCQTQTAPSAQAQKPAPPPEELKFDDAAKFLAGVKGRGESVYRGLESLPAWQDHNTQMDSLWAKFEQTQLGPARDFHKRELTPLVQPGPFVFYPFGGPDVVYVLTFYPQGKTYVLCGLEPVGSVPAPAWFKGEHLAETFGKVRESAGILRRSFFVTSEMDKQFRGRVTDGLTPMILLLLSRTGHVVTGLRFVNLTPEGSLVAYDQPKPNGVEVQFRRADEAEPRKFYYFSGNVSDDKMPHAGFIKFVESQGRSDTLIKSASFLLHWKEFAKMRQLVIDNSNAILQDDTGVPFRTFKEPEWQVSLYGKYSRPDRPFTGHYQKDLAAAFERPGGAKDLGFSLGYGFGRRTSHLVFARRPKMSAQAGGGKPGGRP